VYFVVSHGSSSGRLPGECHMVGNDRGHHAWLPLSETCRSGNGHKEHHEQVVLRIASPRQPGL